MEFFILQDIEINLQPPTHTSDRLIERTSGFLETEIKAAVKHDGADTDFFTKKLISAIIEDLSVFKSKNSTLDWKVKVAISLPNSLAVPAAQAPENLVSLPNEPHSFGTVEIYHESDEERTLLASLEKIFKGTEGCGQNVSINVYINQLGLKDDPAADFSAINLRVTDLKIEHGNVEGNLAQTFKDDLLLAWKFRGNFSSRISVSVVLNSIALNLLDRMVMGPQSKYKHLREMLENAIFWDTEILVGVEPDQVSIKAHRAILATESEVFQSMFESGMREATTNKIEMEGVSETGVRALLAYLYYRDTTALHQSSETALEILQMAEKYNIKGLKFVVQDIMMANQASWFGVETALSLYMFTKAICAKEEEIKDEDEDMESPHQPNAEDEDENKIWNTLKTRSLRVLKWYIKRKPKTLSESVMYNQIYSENFKLGMEISSAMIRLD